MNELIPPAFLFRMALPVRKAAKLPRSGQIPLQLNADYALTDIGELAQGQRFADVRLAWNEKGLGCRIEVTGKKSPPRCDYSQMATSDGLNLWIDTRSTQNIHRASRFCHHFCVLPTGAMKDRKQPTGRQLPIARAKEEAPLCDSKQIVTYSDVRDSGYVLEVWLPTEILHGYEPESNPRVGFYYHLRDHELGDQYLSVGAEFPFDHDPSLWWPLELI
ncbi:MAG: hypothetical protein V4719_15570 [Planctomycetota bacterium]